MGRKPIARKQRKRSPFRETLLPKKKVFQPEELEQLAAAIALYPDALVSQILMAATYALLATRLFSRGLP